MKLVTYSAILLLLCVSSVLPVRAAGRYHDASGGFSYEVPAGWQVMKFKGQKFRILVTGVADNIRPNIIFEEEDYPGDLDTYVRANLPALKKEKNFSILSRGSGETRDGRPYRRLRFRHVQSDHQWLQTMYFFRLAKGRKLLITCTATVKLGSRYDKACMRVVRTFRAD